MKPLTQRVRGQLFTQNNRLALLINQEADALYLRYALVVRGPENPIFPAFVMDDWGQERNTLDIYEWIAKEGQRFPRSDVFGYEMDGSETQYFLRALETFYKFPVFVYPQPELPVPAGMALSRVILPDTDYAGEPQRVPRPNHIPWPLRHANLTWWQANPETLADFGFTKRAL
jgi:hypothetical protein